MVTKSKKTTKKTTSKRSNHKRIKVLSKDGKEFMTSCIDHIAKKVIASRDGSGRTPRGVADNLLQEGQKIFPSMSMNMINYAVKKLSMGKEKSKFYNAIVTVDKETVLSSLSGDTSTTNVTSSSPTKSSNEASTALLMLNNISNTTASSKTVAVTSIQEFIDTNLNVTTTPKSIGRPQAKRNQCCCQYLFNSANRASNKRSNKLVSKQY